MDEVQEIVDYKVYKVKPYLNSDKDPFGLTINGKNKEYIHAHETLKQLMIKGKQYKVNDGAFKILDVSNKKGMINAIVEVLDNDGGKGNVELKIYNPSVNKKKGATIEMRKCSGYEYLHVEVLKSITTTFLDGFIAGDDINDVIKNSRRESVKPAVRSKPKLFNCDLCKWQTKFASALKVHKTRIHNQKQTVQIKCDACDFHATVQNVLDGHMKTAHKPSNKRSKDSVSPTSSPPHKKHYGFEKVFDLHIDESEVEMIDLEIEAKDLISRMLENRIEELEKLVAELTEERKKDIVFKEKEINSSKFSHLSGVMKKHLPKLRGYKLRYKVEGNGACLDNCLAVHVYEDKEEGPKVKKRLNNHVADNWDNYYSNKIPLPYEQIVGVGENAYVTKIATREEMLSFLRSDDALMVYSDSQQVLAMANLFNINVNIFTYGRAEETWNEVKPDPEMAECAEIKFGKWLPNMALYHCEDNHFDLLVKDDSRLALLGLVAGSMEEVAGEPLEEEVAGEPLEDVLAGEPLEEEVAGESLEQELFTRSTGAVYKKEVNTEELLKENDDDDVNNPKDLEEEMTLFKAKQNGHKRISPQVTAESFSKSRTMFKCDKCNSELESEGLLNAHIRSHVDEEFTCDQCDLVFREKTVLEEHKKSDHKKNKITEEWNCNDCSFQGHGAVELINHLKVTGHQPSKDINKKKSFNDYRQCYTCRKEFDGS